ncbi:MAG: phosphatase PAP2 family protein [Actinomycetota bacterium]
MSTAMHRLPARSEAGRIALLGAVMLVLGLGVAALIASDLAAANARDLMVNSWFWNLGQSQGWPMALAEFFSWFADGPRNAIMGPLVAAVLLLFRQWRWAIFLLVSSQLGLVISNVLKFSIARERPPFIENTDLQQHLSFPSGHAFAGSTIWAATAIIAWYVLRPPWANAVAIPLLAIGLLQAPSRLIVGKHWVTDVLGSWLVAGGWLLLVWAAFLWWLAPRPVDVQV